MNRFSRKFSILFVGLSLFQVSRAMDGPLHDAAKRGDVSAVQQLLGDGVDCNQQDATGATPLHLAAEKGHAKIAALLLRAGADLSRVNRSGWTSLHAAARGGSAELVDMLLQAGADHSAKTSGGNTPLHIAANSGRAEVAEVLLTAGADDSARNERGMLGQTPLYCAVMHDRVAVVKVLAKAGADCSAAVGRRNTPLHYAIGSRNVNMVKVLLSLGANYSAQNNEHDTPLHYAVRENNIEIIRALSAAGASCSVKNKQGKTSLQLAKKKRRSAIVEILESGASVPEQGESEQPEQAEAASQQDGGAVPIAKRRRVECQQARAVSPVTQPATSSAQAVASLAAPCSETTKTVEVPGAAPRCSRKVDSRERPQGGCNRDDAAPPAKRSRTEPQQSQVAADKTGAGASIPCSPAVAPRPLPVCLPNPANPVMYYPVPAGAMQPSGGMMPSPMFHPGQARPAMPYPMPVPAGAMQPSGVMVPSPMFHPGQARPAMPQMVMPVSSDLASAAPISDLSLPSVVQATMPTTWQRPEEMDVMCVQALLQIMRQDTSSGNHH